MRSGHVDLHSSQVEPLKESVIDEFMPAIDMDRFGHFAMCLQVS